MYLFTKDNYNSQPSTYEEQAEIYMTVLAEVGIASSKVTQINRNSAINVILHNDVPADQLHQVRRWENDRMAECYVEELPTAAIKVLAGFSSRTADYFLDRAVVEPPQELQEKIFPRLTRWINDFKTLKK